MKRLLKLAASAYCIVSCISGAAIAQTLSTEDEYDARVDRCLAQPEDLRGSCFAAIPLLKVWQPRQQRRKHSTDVVRLTSAGAFVGQLKDDLTEQANPDGYAQVMMKVYKGKLGTFSEFVRTMYFAIGCNVVTGSEQFGVHIMLGTKREALSTEAHRTRIDADDTISLLIRSSERAGLAQASQKGGCAYWHDHPEEAYLFREAAQAAVSSPRW